MCEDGVLVRNQASWASSCAEIRSWDELGLALPGQSLELVIGIRDHKVLGFDGPHE